LARSWFIPFEDVREKIAMRLQQARQQEINQERAKQALSALKEGEKSMQDIARSEGVSFETIRDIQRHRDTELPDKLTQELHAKLFSLPAGDFAEAASKERYLIARSINPELPETPDLSTEKRAKLIEELENVQSSLIMMTYFQDLSKDYDVQINHALLDRLYGLNTGESR
jgi:hypothetical protein